jgi:signal transduction histidine kinase
VSFKSPSGAQQSLLSRDGARGHPAELSRHLVEAQEEERKRISRELHDEAGQGLMALRLYLGLLASDTPDREVTAKVEEAISMLDRTIGDLRRIIARLSPRTLNELGLLPAIRKEARLLSKNTGMKGTLDLPANWGGVPREIEIVIYRTVQEALHNIAKHSRASRFSVRLEAGNGTLILRVEDDGVGFVSKPNFEGSFGLLGMRERIAALGGTVRIRARQGRGARIRVTLPGSWQEFPVLGQGRPAPPQQQPDRAQPSEKKTKAASFRGLVKPDTPYSHAHQLHSS